MKTKKLQISHLIFVILIGVLLSLPIVKIGAAEKPSLQKTQEYLIKYKDSSEIVLSKINSDLELVELKKDPMVEYVEPNYIYKASIIPSDTYFQNQWYLNKIKAPEAWNITRESPNTVIAVIDSGVQISHPDLKDNIWINKKEIQNNGIDDDKNGFIDDVNGWDFVNNTADPAPKFNDGFTEDGVLHGTIIAGIIAASGNNAAGVSGVLWRAQIMPLKVLDDVGEGDTGKVVAAIDYATNNNADIINLSFTGFGFSKSLDEAIKRAYDAGVIIVAAAGNEQGQGQGYNLDRTPIYPACHDGPYGENRVIGVAATDSIDQKTYFSSYGSNCVDISAPGVSIFGTTVYEPNILTNGNPLNKYYSGYWSGTSVAAPIVSGVIALIEETNPKMEKKEIIDTLLNYSDNISRLNPNYIGLLGKGRVNAQSSVRIAKNLLENSIEKLMYSNFSNYSTTSEIIISDLNGKIESSFAPIKNYAKGVNLASGDINGDKSPEIIMTQSVGGEPLVKIFSENGQLISEFYAYDKKFRGGVNIAVGDINKDGKKEIITAPMGNGGPNVRAFDHKGKLMANFMAYDKNYRGGVNIACGDVNGDGYEEMITGPGKNLLPEVRIFQKNKLIKKFIAYDKNYRGGVNVAVGKTEKGTTGKKYKIITAPANSGGPHIRIFEYPGTVVGQFFSYSSNYRNGVNVAMADLNNDGYDEIITATRSGGSPHIKSFNTKGVLLGSFFGFKESYAGGVSISSLSK